MLQNKVFISKFGAINALTASAITTSEVTTLKHKVGDDSVELRALVVKRDARSTVALLTSAQSTEVLSTFGGYIVSENELNGTSRLTTNATRLYEQKSKTYKVNISARSLPDVEEYLRTGFGMLSVASHFVLLFADITLFFIE